MDFAAPERLWLLVLVAGLVVAYVIGQRRRRQRAARFASPGLLPLLVPGRGPGRWRHLTAGVFAAGLALATMGAAQPTVPGEAEREQATIVIAIDTSDSMKATDVEPDRITAAVNAARAFIEDLPAGFHVGLVTADASPVVIVAPTTDHAAVVEALQFLELSPGTALGEAIFTALATLPREAGTGLSLEGGDDEEGGGPAAHIILLSDGVSTTGRADAEAVEAAVDAGVPVSTIAFGTDDASVISQGQVVEVPVDERALRVIAGGTEGTFFEAATTAELRTVYQQIDADVTVVPTDIDIADWFAGGALILLVAAVVVSLLTTARVVWT